MPREELIANERLGITMVAIDWRLIEWDGSGEWLRGQSHG